jgi:hypothetical protein
MTANVAHELNMRLSLVFIAVLSVWMSAAGALALPTEVVYKLSVQETADSPPGLGDISPTQRAEIVADFNDHLVPAFLPEDL